MKTPLALALLLLAPSIAHADDSPFGSQRDWKKAGFGNPVIAELRPPASLRNREFTHSLKVLFVMFRHAGWRQEDVQSHFEWAAKTYAQCGVRFDPSPLVMADAPDGKVSIDPQKDEVDDGNIARRIPTHHRPAIILVKRNISFPNGYSYNTVVPPKETALIGTAYLDSTVLNSIIKLSYFNVLSHELAHILVNAGHNGDDPPNILSAPIPHADTITEEQCEAIRSYPAVKPLR